MKKSLAMTLAFVFVFGIFGMAFASPSPFVDVPADHWSYAAINKLVSAGIIDGMGDGTFQGDKTMTRYEMAQIVGKLMVHTDKANAEQKALIDKLAGEFANELQAMGVRVTNLEKKVGNIKLTGEIRSRYEWSKDADQAKYVKDDELVSKAGQNPAYKTRIRIGMEAPVTDELTFKARYGTESYWGTNNDLSNTAKVDQAYLTGKVLGLDKVSFGRQPIFLGKGLLMDLDHSNDGLVVGFGKDLQVTAGVFKNNATPCDVMYKGILVPGDLLSHFWPVNENYFMGQLAYAFNKDFDMTAAYLKDKDSEYYKTLSVGLTYKFNDFALTGEYGKNKSQLAQDANNGSDAKAWLGTLKYRGATATPNTYGIWVGYRKADAGFDPMWFSTPDMSDVYGGNALNNVKGLEYGFEYALFKNGVLTAKYLDLKTNDSNETPVKNFIAQLVYTF